VISPAFGQPPFALDGTVTVDKLIELLAVQTELPELDYKLECDLSDTGALVELTKDVGRDRAPPPRRRIGIALEGVGFDGRSPPDPGS